MGTDRFNGVKGEYEFPQEKFDMENADAASEHSDHVTEVRAWKYLFTRVYWMDLMLGSFAECLGMTIFVFVCILSNQTGDAFAVAFTAGTSISLLIMTFAQISGAHFNPAVSVGFFVIGETSLMRMVFYIVTQSAGSIAGAFLAKAILSNSIVVTDTGNITQFEAINGGAHFLHGGISPGLAIVAEATYCFSMMIVVYSAAVDNKTKTELGPLAIAFIITVCILAGFNNTSGSFNPARSLGSAVAIQQYRPDVWDHHYVYWLGPISGSIVSALVYRICFAGDEHSIRKQIVRLV